MHSFKKDKIIFHCLLVMFVLSTNMVSAQEQETCSIDTTKTIDVNKIVNTLTKRIKLSGYAHVGYYYNSQQSPRDEFKIPRIIFMADARINKQLNMYFMFDFRTSSLHELYLNYSASKAFNVRIGQFKNPFSMENQLSPTVLEMTYCSSLVTTYMIGGGNELMMKGASGRDLGLNVYGKLFGNNIEYSLAVMNGQGRNNNDGNSQKDFAGRLSYHPLPWLTLSSSIILGTGNVAVTESTTAPKRYICTSAPEVTGFKSNGNFTRNRYAAGLCIENKYLGLRSEYMHGKDGNYNSDGCYATACIKRIATNFDGVLSYDWLNIYSGKQNRYSAGVQYWFYPKCRLQLVYGYETSNTQHNRNIVQGQIQVRF